jgi:hypothetical protein
MNTIPPPPPPPPDQESYIAYTIQTITIHLNVWYVTEVSSLNHTFILRFEVLAAEVMKSSISWG